MRLPPLAAATTMLLLALPAAAQSGGLREFCGDRPGLSIEPCTVDPGHLQGELQVAGWTLDRQPDSRKDTIEAGQLLLRYGAGSATELRVTWTAYGHERERDRMSGDVQRASGIGDVTLGVKQNLHAPDGSGFSIALLPRVTLPAGHTPIGDGTWSANLLIPISYEIVHGTKLTLNPRVDAAANESGHGRHLAYSSVIGIESEVVKDWVVDLELQALRDRDPEEHETRAFASASLAHMIGERLQLDTGAVAGLNRDSADIEVYCGVSRKF